MVWSSVVKWWLTGSGDGMELGTFGRWKGFLVFLVVACG